MRELEIIVTPRAEVDMQEIFDFIAKDNVIKAIEMIDIFERQFELLAIFPKSGYRKSAFTKRDVRESVVAKHYQIIYTLNNERLYILRVLTGYEDCFTLS